MLHVRKSSTVLIVVPAMLDLLLNCTAWAFLTVHCILGEIVVSPPGSPVYFWIDSPATISCTARVPSGNVEESVMLVQLTTGTDALSAVNCFTARSSPPLVNLLSPSFGNVTLSRSYPQSSAINCSYTFTPTSSFRDGSYSCIAAYQSPPSDVQTFVVVTSSKCRWSDNCVAWYTIFRLNASTWLHQFLFLWINSSVKFQL